MWRISEVTMTHWQKEAPPNINAYFTTLNNLSAIYTRGKKHLHLNIAYFEQHDKPE